VGKPSAKFFEGQIAPDLPMFSQDNIDWYAEMKRRSLEGFSFRGDRLTGDQWWFYNMCPMTVAILDKFGNPTKDFDMGFPYWSQEDDYLFKQIEEAEQDDLGVFLMTGRSFGKTQIVISIGGKIFYLKPGSHGLISASSDSHANATWIKFGAMLNGVNKAHPSLHLDLLKSNDNEIISGDEIFDQTKNKWITETYSMMEKIVYGNLPGKTKGRRVDFQHWEEVGDWQNSATLKECIAASRGTYWVGKTKKAREFYTGTGGTVLSDQAKEIAHNPDAYGLYKVYNWNKRGTCIIIPAYKKYGGYWEKTGISDEIGAKAELERLRELAKTDPDPTAYNKLIQEYPFDIHEMFSKQGGNNFDQKILAKQITYLEEDPSRRKGMWVNLHWRKKDGKTIGVDWEESPNGKVWMLEPPVINMVQNIVEPRLYVGGYDGIDLGVQDTASGLGSRGALSIKKRLLPGAGLSNIYVCHYFERPQDIEDFYETCHMIMMLYSASTNIEASKIGLVGHLRHKKGLHYLMKRPRLTLQNIEKEENESTLIGTTPTTKNFQYAETYTAKHIKEYGEQIMCLPVLIDLRDFSMDNRGAHDITMSIFMAELADDELMDQPAGIQKPTVVIEDEYGYYTDRKGIKHFGKIPKSLGDQFGFQDQQYLDGIKNGKAHYLNSN
jgi:hypothetical protein